MNSRNTYWSPIMCKITHLKEMGVNQVNHSKSRIKGEIRFNLSNIIQKRKKSNQGKVQIKWKGSKKEWLLSIGASDVKWNMAAFPFYSWNDITLCPTKYQAQNQLSLPLHYCVDDDWCTDTWFPGCPLKLPS